MLSPHIPADPRLEQLKVRISALKLVALETNGEDQHVVLRQILKFQREVESIKRELLGVG